MSSENNFLGLRPQFPYVNQNGKIEEIEPIKKESVSTNTMLESVKPAIETPNKVRPVKRPKPIAMSTKTVPSIGIQSVGAKQAKGKHIGLEATLRGQLQEGKKIIPEQAMKYLQEITSLDSKQLNKRIKEQQKAGFDLIGISLKVLNSNLEIMDNKEAAKKVLYSSKAIVSKLRSDPMYKKQDRLQLTHMVGITQKIYDNFPMDYCDVVEYLSPLTEIKLFEREFASNKEKLLTAISIFKGETGKKEHSYSDSFIKSVTLRVEENLEIALRTEFIEHRQPLEARLSNKLREGKEIFPEQGLMYLKGINQLNLEQLNARIKYERQQGIDLIAHCIKVANENPRIAHDKEVARDTLNYTKLVVSKLRSDPTYRKIERQELDQIVHITQKIYDSFPMSYKDAVNYLASLTTEGAFVKEFRANRKKLLNAISIFEDDMERDKAAYPDYVIKIISSAVEKHLKTTGASRDDKSFKRVSPPWEKFERELNIENILCKERSKTPPSVEEIKNQSQVKEHIAPQNIERENAAAICIQKYARAYLAGENFQLEKLVLEVNKLKEEQAALELKKGKIEQDYDNQFISADEVTNVLKDRLEILKNEIKALELQITEKEARFNAPDAQKPDEEEDTLLGWFNQNILNKISPNDKGNKESEIKNALQNEITELQKELAANEEHIALYEESLTDTAQKKEQLVNDKKKALEEIQIHIEKVAKNREEKENELNPAPLTREKNVSHADVVDSNETLAVKSPRDGGEPPYQNSAPQEKGNPHLQEPKMETDKPPLVETTPSPSKIMKKDLEIRTSKELASLLSTLFSKFGDDFITTWHLDKSNGNFKLEISDVKKLWVRPTDDKGVFLSQTPNGVVLLLGNNATHTIEGRFISKNQVDFSKGFTTFCKYERFLMSGIADGTVQSIQFTPKDDSVTMVIEGRDRNLKLGSREEETRKLATTLKNWKSGKIATGDHEKFLLAKQKKK